MKPGRMAVWAAALDGVAMPALAAAKAGAGVARPDVLLIELSPSIYP